MKPPFSPVPRPDLMDSLVSLWLQGAVTMAHLMTAPFDGVRASWPAPSPTNTVHVEGDIPEGMGQDFGEPTVSPIRPEDIPHAAPGCTETCADCRFYCAANEQAGECRRDEPVLSEDGHSALWPVVKGKDWCGAFFPALTGLPVH